MKFFKPFPKIEYPGNISPTGVYQDLHIATNIMLSVRFRELLRNNTVFFYPYTVTDQDRPDIVASKYYGSADYTWVILLTNDIMDPLYDWPLTYTDFINYVKKKYGTLEYAYTTTKRYFNENGFVIDETSYLALPAVNRSSQSVYEWEKEINDDKREIRLLDNVYLTKVLSEFRDLMKSV